MKIKTTKEWALFFDYLPLDELMVVVDRVEKQISLPLVFIDDNNIEKFCVIFDIDEESIHVRHIGGAYAWKWNWIEKACVLLCKMTYKNKITVLAQENFMKHAVNKLGFIKSEAEFQYEKVIG